MLRAQLRGTNRYVAWGVARRGRLFLLGSDVTEDGVSIRGPLLHVDGLNQIRFTDTRITYNPATGRCAGNCHGESHSSERW